MKKQILLYNNINPDTAANFINELEANKDNELVCRVNCPGGDPYSTYGMIAVADSIPNLKYHADGQANSCAFYLLAKAAIKGTSECLNFTTFIAHRASTWMEKYPDMMTPEIKSQLADINGDLRSIIENNLPEFENVTGVTLDKVFSMEGKKLDVRINAKQAKKMGLVSKVNNINPKLKTEIVAWSNQYGIAAFADNSEININSNSNIDTMEITTLSEFKAQYPTIYAEAKAEGIELEKNRIAGWEVWRKYDAKAVDLGIASNKEITSREISEFSAKAVAPEYLASLRAGNQNVTTSALAINVDMTPEEKEIKAFAERAKALRDKQ